MIPALRQSPKFLDTGPLWTVRVLAWIAFLISGYLAWTTLGQIPIAGCAGGGLFDCHAVHNSTWSMWLTLPVALAGLACYAALAGVSVVAGWDNTPIARWLRTLLVMLSVTAAGAAIWFIALQVFVIGSICTVCMAVHLCGLVVAGIVVWAAWRQPISPGPPRIPSAGLAALRTTMTLPTKSAPQHIPPHDGSPWIGPAAGGAAFLLALLIGGQILFPAKTYDVMKSVELDKPIQMGGSNAPDHVASTSHDRPSQPHVAMRVPAERSKDASTDEVATADLDGSNSDGSIGDSRDATSANSAADADGNNTQENGVQGDSDGETLPSSSGRILKLLGGKLTLDVYKQPVLGSPDAPHVLVELVSYDCPHCRKAHSMIKNGRARYGDQLAVVVLPVPLEKSCNRLVKNFNPDHQGSCALARYALTVASINPAAFEEFHEWLMTGDKAPSTEKTMAKAYELVGRDRARSVAYGDDIKTRISENVDLFASLQQQHSANRNFGLPVQIMKNGVMSGAANQPDAVYRTWEEHLGLEPPLDATKL